MGVTLTMRRFCFCLLILCRLSLLVTTGSSFLFPEGRQLLSPHHQPLSPQEALSIASTIRSSTLLFSSTSKKDDNKSDTSNNSNWLSASKIYFDIQVAGNDIGRFVFALTNPSKLPRHAENLIQLTKGSRRAIDPQAHYVGCQFDYSPATIEDGMGRYRWGHSLKGRGRNAIGPADAPIKDAQNQLQCTHSCFGGQYYGDKYDESELDDNDPGVYLTVSVAGPGYGSSKFSIVRVRESPREWGERLLLNAGVIGKMMHDQSSLATLHAMARQRLGPPTIVACGVLDE